MWHKDWVALIRKLKRAFPLEGTVRVIRRPYKRDCGYTTFDGELFTIRVDSRMSYQTQVDTLLHEWAHARAIQEAYCHRGRWGEIHGEIYQSWCEDFQ